MTFLKNKLIAFSRLDIINELCMTGFLGILMLFQRFFTGVYKPVMDDWFLYGDLYTTISDRLSLFAIPNEKFAIRPFAGIADIFINAPLFEHLWVAELILTLSLLIGAYLIIHTLKKNKLGSAGFLLCLICLSPVGLEATYWIAAATRVSYSILFIGGAVYTLDCYYKQQRKLYLVLFAVLGVFSVSFYEPAIIIYIILASFIVWSNFKNKKDLVPVLLLALHIAAIGVYYIINSGSGEMESRGELVSDDFTGHLIRVYEYIKLIFTQYTKDILVHGCTRGLDVMSISTRICLGAVSIMFGIFAALCLDKQKFSFKILLLGLGLFAGGLILNFVLGSERIPLRLVYFSYLGIGIIADELITLLPKIPAKAVIAVISSLCAFVFTLSGVGEVRDYQETSDFDVYIAQQMIDIDKNNNLINPDKNSYLFDGQFYYEETGCIRYHDHIRGASATYAELTGCIRHLTNTAFTNNVMTFPNGDINNVTPYIDDHDLCSFYVLNYDKTVSAAYVIPDGDDYIVKNADTDKYVGKLVKVDDTHHQFITE